MSGSEESDLERFGRHLPRILEKQLLVNYASRFISHQQETQTSFTVLSQRLHVDELRTHINAYFKRILDCIECHGGDCIKFAGDALFVIWQTEIPTDNDKESFESKARAAVERALRCGIDINATCSNYRIALKTQPSSSGNGNHQERSLGTTRNNDSDASSLVLSPLHATNNNGMSPAVDVEYSYLNVHAGLSVGRITGIDVGHMDRWEYLIVGQPLHDVAKAEGDAGKGEIVISAEAHRLICCGVGPTSSNSPDEEVEEELPTGFSFAPCGCCMTPSGCFRIPEQKVAKLPPVANPEDDEDDLDLEMAFYQSVVSHATSAFETIKEQAVKGFLQLDLADKLPLALIQPAGGEQSNNNDNGNNNGKNINMIALRSPRGSSAPVQHDLHEVIFSYFLRWICDCLRDDFARHVHEADRVDVKLMNVSRLRCLDSCAADFARSLQTANNRGSYQHQRGSGCSINSSALTVTVDSARSPSAASTSSPSGSAVPAPSYHSHSHHHSSSSASQSFVSRLRGLASSATSSSSSSSGTATYGPPTAKDRSQARHNRTLRRDGGLGGEQRRVIVMFVSIHGEPAMSATHDLHGSGNGSNSDLRSIAEAEEGAAGSTKDDVSTLKDSSAKKSLLSSLPAEFVVPASFNFIDSGSNVGNKVDVQDNANNSNTIEKSNGNVVKMREQDALLLAHYQSCMEVLVSSLSSKGGQLRQFIVDDKGKVAIGTFGLRGSVAYDNAAAAVEAAQMILKGLQAKALDAAIGIASGHAYCGIVGSLRRHEYAVMGPNVNLAARLMGKAGIGHIITDENIKVGDRMHHFQAAGSVQAKGFATPINIFRPVKSRASTTFDAITIDESLLLRPAMARSGSTSPVPLNPIRLSSDGNSVQSDENSKTAAGRRKKNRLYGRDEVEKKILDFAVSSCLVMEEEGSDPNPQSSLSSLIAEPEAAAEVDELLQQLAMTDSSTKGEQSPAKSKKSTRNTNDNNNEKKKSPLLKHDCGAKMALVKGGSGLGKSAVLQLIATHLEIDLLSAGCNLDVFHGMCSSLNSTAPYKSWRSIIRSMLARYARLDPSYEPNNNSSGGSGNRREAGRLQALWHAGLKFVERQIPAEHREFLVYVPLLTVAQLIPGLEESEATKELSVAEKLTKLGCVLQFLVGQYASLTGRVCYIVMDDCHYADSHSLKLLLDLWLSAKGLVILSSWSTTMMEANKAMAEMKEIVQANLQELEGIAESNRVIKLHLENLDLAAIKQMVSEAFLDELIVTTDEEIFATIERITGGNPLFVYEITKAVVDKYKTMMVNDVGGEVTNDEMERADLFKHVEKVNDRQSNLLTGILHSFRGGRVEEIIFFRFDRLAQKVQLVLKMGSVAAASNAGRGFSLDLLAFMFKGSSNSRSKATYNASSDVNHERGNSSMFFGEFFEEVVGVFADSAREQLEVRRNLALLIKKLLSSGEFLTTVRSSHRNSITDKSISGGSVDENNLNNVGQENGDGPHRRISLGEMAATIDLDSLPSESYKAGTDSNEDVILVEMQEVDFDFKIAVERTTIYDLLLTEQRESLHDRVASFLERANAAKRERDTLSSNDLNEEAFHWEQARIFDNALRCYAQASSMLADLGAYKESYSQLKKAYACYANMKEQSGVARLVNQQLDSKTYGDILDHARSLSRPVASLFARPEKAMSQQQQQQQRADQPQPPAPVDLTATAARERLKEIVVKKKALFQIFDGDSSVLQTALDMIVRFAQTSFTLGEDIHVTEQLYNEALQMIYIAWRMDGQADIAWKEAVDEMNSNDSSYSNDYASPRAPDHSDLYIHYSNKNKGIIDPEELKAFSLADPEVAFPVLSGIAAMYRLKRLPDEGHVKEYAMYELMKGLAMTAPEQFEVHILQAKCLLRAAFMEAGRRDEAEAITDSMMKFYDFDKHSAKLVKVYGNDRAGYTMAMTLQVLIAGGKMDKAAAYIAHIWPIATKMQRTHLHSLGTISIPLSCAMVMLGKVKEAQQVFDLYYDTETARGPEVYSFFRPVNPLYHDWLAMQMRCLQEGSAANKGIVRNCLELSEVQEKMLHKRYYIEDKKQQPLIFDALPFFGVGVEFVCGDVLSMVATSWMRWMRTMDNNRDDGNDNDSGEESNNSSNELYLQKRAAIAHEAERALSVAKEYIDLSVQLHGEQATMINYLMSLLCRAKIIMLQEKLRQIVSKEPLSRRCVLPALREAVLAFGAVGLKHDLPYCSFFAALIFEQMVDPMEGAAMRKMAAESLQMGSDPLQLAVAPDQDLFETFLPSFLV